MLKITDISGLTVGHSTHPTEKTGCTAIVCKSGAIAGVDIRGAAPGTRETALLQPTFMIQKIHAVMLTGGSAFGLRTADGAMQYLSKNKIGLDTGEAIVPIVPAAVIYDLSSKRNPAFPSVEMGYDACKNAKKTFQEGLVGAGTGATVGKILGADYAMKGGIASSGMELPSGVQVGVIVVVNAVGDILNSKGEIIAGAREPKGKSFLNTYQTLVDGKLPSTAISGTNTTLAVVATNAKFNKEEINKIAQMAQNGIARSTRPAHTMFDGDVVFALSTSTSKTADVSLVGEAAAQMVSKAIVRAVTIGNQ